MSLALLAISARTLHGGGVSRSVDDLVHLAATGVAEVRHDVGQGHDFGAADDDSTDRHQLSHVLGGDFSRGQTPLGSRGNEVDFTETTLESYM